MVFLTSVLIYIALRSFAFVIVPIIFYLPCNMLSFRSICGLALVPCILPSRISHPGLIRSGVPMNTSSVELARLDLD